MFVILSVKKSRFRGTVVIAIENEKPVGGLQLCSFNPCQEADRQTDLRDEGGS